MEDVLRQRQKRGFRLGLLILVVLAALLGIYLLRDIFTPLIAGFLIAYILDPLADVLERLKLSRLASVIIIFSGASLIALLMVFTAGFYITKGVMGAYDAVVGDEWIADADPGTTGPSWTEVDSPQLDVHFEDRNGNGEFDPGYIRRTKKRLDALLTERCA